MENRLRKFDKLKLDLDQAIQLDDVELVGRLDKECTQSWNELLSLKPICSSDSRMLFIFLLNQINELMDYSIYAKQITEKIVILHDENNYK